MISRSKKRFYIALVLTIIMFVSAGCRTKTSQKEPNEIILCEKPVIYLYPTKEQKVSVKLDFQGQLICTYPEYNDGWTVTAKPDGTLINHEDNREYSYLFWEGTGKDDWDMSKGFVVKGEDTKDFLQQTLSKMGLSPREYNEFIVYWLPQMQNNEYNLISFAEQEYEEYVKLKIDPAPDSILRVFMVFKAIDKSVKVQEQIIKPFERRGFTVIEWGAAEIKAVKNPARTMDIKGMAERTSYTNPYGSYYERLLYKDGAYSVKELLQLSGDQDINYGGRFLDEEGILNINLVYDSAKNIEQKELLRIIEEASKGLRIKIHNVRFSLEQLQQANDILVDNMVRGYPKGLLSIGVNEQQNRINITVKKITPEIMEEIGKLVGISMISFTEGNEATFTKGNWQE